LWQEAIELNFTDHNPWKEVKKSKKPLGKNIAHLPYQQKEILDYVVTVINYTNFLVKNCSIIPA
jgi:hypothetical protein